MKQEAELNAEQDKKLREDAEVLNRADGTIFQTEKSIKDLDDKLTEEQKSELNGLLGTLKESYEKKDIEKINQDIENLNSKFQSISQSLYEQNATEEGNDAPSDVEFEEVL